MMKDASHNKMKQKKIEMKRLKNNIILKEGILSLLKMNTESFHMTLR